MPGPGVTIMTMPMPSTVPPTTPMAMRLATLYVPKRGCLSSNTKRDLMTAAGGILRETRGAGPGSHASIFNLQEPRKIR